MPRNMIRPYCTQPPSVEFGPGGASQAAAGTPQSQEAGPRAVLTAHDRLVQAVGRESFQRSRVLAAAEPGLPRARLSHPATLLSRG